MERIVEGFVSDYADDPVALGRMTMEVQHDLAVVETLAKRRTTYVFIMAGLSLLIIATALAGVLNLLEFTPGVFTLIIIQMSWMFVVCDLLRGVHLDTMHSRLRYPELYTPDGRYYKRILMTEAVRAEAERLMMTSAERIMYDEESGESV